MTQPLALRLDASKSSNSPDVQSPTWIVLDTRTAESGIQSGVSRFVVGLAGGLAQVLAGKESRSVQLLLIGKREPHAWIVALVQNYPSVVSYWSGGPGALTRRFDRPVWLWPSRVVTEIAHKTGEDFFWVAPGNFDRPLIWSFGRRKWKSKLVQIIHDTIPFSQKASMGFFFRMQFCYLVKKTLASFPAVFTVSSHTSNSLVGIAPRRAMPVAVIGNGIDAIFGAQRKIFGDERFEARMRFLALLFPQLGEPVFKETFVTIAKSRWVVGVGRYQKYKGWESAEAATQILRGSFGEGVWFLRVGLCAKDTQRLAKTEQQSLGQGALFPTMNMLGLPELSDSLLAVLYSLSDVCAHPSRAEGFGFPPLEAAFCGTPVVYRKGTAVDEHFGEGTTLPLGFATAVDTNETQALAQAIAWVFEQQASPGSPLGVFLAQIGRADSAGQIMGPLLNSQRYEWRACADRFLDAVVHDSKGQNLEKGGHT
jgi:glycosyltransferase involved in cell wall biosynthesis